jgi:nitroreductase
VDFEHVVRARRMVRNYRDEPVDAALVNELLTLASKGPSAGNTWGTHFVVLEGPEETAQYWDLTLPAQKRETFPWPGLLRAPVLILPCGDAAAYVERYSLPDKARTGLGASSDAWNIPYWHVDTAMATMILLHAATNAGLGALFFGVFDHEPAVCNALGIPVSVRPIGAVALGWPSDTDHMSKSAKKGRPGLDEIVHRGGW